MRLSSPRRGYAEGQDLGGSRSREDVAQGLRLANIRMNKPRPEPQCVSSVSFRAVLEVFAQCRSLGMLRRLEDSWEGITIAGFHGAQSAWSF